MSPQPATDHPDATVRREVLLDAPVDAVWDALRDGAGLSGWLADEVDLDVLPGATGTVRDGDGPRRPVRVDEVREGRGLALVWSDEAGVETLVDLALTPEDDGTGDDARRRGTDGVGGGRPERARTRLVVVEVPLVLVSAVSVGAARTLAGARGGPGGASSPTAAASAGRSLAGLR